jgi:nuclear control of ATPase protein 2
LEWLIVSKAAAQVYGLVLEAFLRQIIPLSNEIWYWDTVLGSHRYTSLYTLQKAPLRFWGWSKSIYAEVWERLDSIRTSEIGVQQAQASLTAQWKQYYGLVRQTIRDRSVADLQSKIMSPVTRSRIEVRQKQHYLRRLREMGASGLGVLMDEALRFEADDSSSEASKNGTQASDEWRSIVSKSVALMETVLVNVTTLETGVTEFEDLVFSHVENDPEDGEHASPTRPAILARKLHEILTKHIPNYENTSMQLVREHGRPSRLIRYWIPATALLLSSTTLLRIFFRREAEILDWVRGIGSTTLDFWYNWVVEPMKRVIGTIRHDKDSEIAIMSQESLEGDRASLERMVTDFAVDHANDTGPGRGLTEAEISEIRSKVREGDLTPVLKAYERDLRKPFMGTVRGDLIRALLIQIQKTKVDVEVALGGIDNLLKSQELLFGSVGLAPGVLVCFSLSRWLMGTFGSGTGRMRRKGKARIVRVLRSVSHYLHVVKGTCLITAETRIEFSHPAHRAITGCCPTKSMAFYFVRSTSCDKIVFACYRARCSANSSRMSTTWWTSRRAWSARARLWNGSGGRTGNGFSRSGGLEHS